MSVDSFIPEKQPEKLAIIEDVASLLGPSLSPPATLPPPSAAVLADALNATAAKLDKLVAQDDRFLPLAQHLKQVAAAGPQAVLALQAALVPGLVGQIDTLKKSLDVHPISFDTLPPELKREWLADDGRARVQAVPNGDLRTEKALVRFAKAIRAVAANATGLPIAVEQSEKVVVSAFTQAGLSAVVVIALLLGLMLRRTLDAFLVVLPLIMGSLYTVIGLVVGGLAINFANIIALPLLLGIGVAFNIYFVVNWRHGMTGHLQSATTRAVLFSALTTGLAFGSLAMSPHRGTASMGLLLFLSLFLSVATTFVVMPALFSLLGKRPS
jgi:hypothetical protein